MAFSLKSLLKGRKKDAQDAFEDEGDDPFAPSTSEEIPAMEAERMMRSSKKAKPTPLQAFQALISKATAALPIGSKKKKDTDAGPDPFNNPELMALIASEVAAIPLPDAVAEADPEPEIVKRKTPPQEADARSAAVPDEDSDEEILASEDDSPAAMAKKERDFEGMPNFAMPDPMKSSTSYEGDDSFGDGFSLGGVDDDDRPAGAMTQTQDKRRKVAILAAAGVVGAAVIGGGLWMMMGSNGADEPAVAGTIAGQPPAKGPDQKQATEGAAGISGNSISMALPPPPAMDAATPAADNTAATDRSSSRRPWLTDGSANPAAQPAGETAAPPAADAQAQAQAQDNAKAQADAKAKAEADAAAAKANAAAPASKPQDPPKTTDTAMKGGSQVALGALPTLQDPKQPKVPGANDTIPSYDKLPKPKQPPAPLDPAPVLDLVRQTPLGALPVRAADGRTAWQTYARPFKAPPNTPRVALVVVGLGLDTEATAAAITSLPPEITLAFSPYSPKLSEQLAAARANGHEVLIDLPMEPDSFPAQDPGPLAMLTTLSPAENVTRLETALAKGSGYTGVISRMGSKFSASAKSLRPVLETLSSRGLLYVSSGATGGLAENVDLPLPMVESVVTVDQRLFGSSIDSRLQFVLDAAKARGTAVAVVRAYPLSFQRVVDWAAGLPAKGVHLAPVSATVSGSEG